MTNSRWTFTSYASFGHASLARCWQDLERRARPSCFQSWAWVGTWLECLPPSVSPHIAVRESEAGVTGLAVVCPSRSRRHRVLSVRSWNLTETGSPSLDNLTIEHNGPLLDATADSYADAFFGDLLSLGGAWDELVLSGIDESRLPEINAGASASQLRIEEFDRKPYYWVDLEELRSRNAAYLDALSSNTRYQIRRSRRAYEKEGPLVVSAPASVTEACDYFAALERLHQKYWQARGHSGAFARPLFKEFHTRFIQSQWANGAVELLRICAGEREIGYLYNLVTDGATNAYQSGYAYDEGQPHLKPGLVSHAAAVERSLASGRRLYDFLAGRSQYKESLATHSAEMVWLRVQRPRLKFLLERGARSLWRRIKAARQTANPKGARESGSSAVAGQGADAASENKASRQG